MSKQRTITAAELVKACRTIIDSSPHRQHNAEIFKLQARTAKERSSKQ